jgi:hypothetical protein
MWKCEAVSCQEEQLVAARVQRVPRHERAPGRANTAVSSSRMPPISWLQHTYKDALRHMTHAYLPEVASFAWCSLSALHTFKEFLRRGHRRLDTHAQKAE